MTVYKPKGSPYYHYDFQAKGKRYYGSTGLASKRDAERYERDRRTEAALGKTEKPSLTVDEATGVYWDNRGQFESNKVTTEYQLANLNRLYGSRTFLHDIDDLSIAKAIATRRGETKRNSEDLVSNATVNRETELLKRVIRHVSKTYKAPDIEWRRHKLKERAERIREASDTEEAALFEVLRQEDADLADLVEFALLSGARKDSVVKLLWSKVDLSKGEASVLAKGKVWHKILLTPRLVAIIANRPKVGPFVFTYVCKRPSPARGDRPRRIKGERYPFSKNGWARRWYAALKEAGLVDFRFHDLRHTAGTRITRVSNLKVAQKLLGHTRIETTARYAHVDEVDIRAAMTAAEQSRNSPEDGVVTTLKNSAKTRSKAQ